MVEYLLIYSPRRPPLPWGLQMYGPHREQVHDHGEIGIGMAI